MSTKHTGTIAMVQKRIAELEAELAKVDNSIQLSQQQLAQQEILRGVTTSTLADYQATLKTLEDDE